MYYCDRKGLKVVQTQRPGIIKATLSRTVFSVASSAPFSSGAAWDVKILTCENCSTIELFEIYILLIGNIFWFVTWKFLNVFQNNDVEIDEWW